MTSLPPSLSNDFTVTKGIPGEHLPTVWPALHQEQREAFMQDLADFFVGLANCSIPSDVLARQQCSSIGHPLSSKELIQEELDWRFLEDVELHTLFSDLLDRLIKAHPDPASLNRMVVDQDDWWKIKGGNILVDPSTGHINAVLGESLSTPVCVMTNVDYCGRLGKSHNEADLVASSIRNN